MDDPDNTQEPEISREEHNRIHLGPHRFLWNNQRQAVLEEAEYLETRTEKTSEQQAPST